MSKTNLAYDLDRYQPLSSPKEEKSADLKVLQATKKSRKISYATMVVLFFMGIVSVMTILFIKMELTEISSEITTAQKKLDGLSSEEVRLKMAMEGIVSEQNIEEKAGRMLGVGKEEPSQVTYVSLANESTGEVLRAKEGFFHMLKTQISKIGEYIGNLFNKM